MAASSPAAVGRRRVPWWLVLPAALPLAGPCAEAEKPPPKAPPPVPIVAAKAESRPVSLEIRTIGSVQAFRTVAVKARVGGQITSVNFEEGQEIKQGQLLFTLDPRPLDAAVAQAEANVLRDQAAVVKEQAALAKAEIDVVRYKALRASNTVAEEIYQEVLLRRRTLEAAVEAGNAMVEAGKAAVRAATVLREYATIESAIDGVAGDLLVDLGNVIKADDTAPLVVINQITPIYVQFAVAEKHLPELRRYMRQGELRVLVTPPGEDQPLEGKLSFLDNSVDRTTGTIQLKGTFANDDKRLWPGQFVDVVLVLASIPEAVIVPAEAVQTSQQGDYAYVVTADNTVEMRHVTVRDEVGGETERVIESGVKAGETVVVDGHLRLVPGAKVTVREAGAVASG